MIASSVTISFGGLVVRSIDDADVWQINFYRSIAFGTVICLILLVRYRVGAIRRMRDIGRPGILCGILLTLAGVAILEAFTNTTIANTLFMLSAIPFLTAGMAWLFLHERLSRATLVTMVAAALGVAVMMAEGIGTGSGYGNFMALVTALSFSGFAVVVRSNRKVDMLPALLVAAALITALALALRWGDLALSRRDILLCFLWGGLLSGLGNAMFIFASRHLIAAELTLFMLLEFALGPLWVWLFINEVPGRWTMMGGLAVILAVTARAALEMRGARPRLKRGRPSPLM